MMREIKEIDEEQKNAEPEEQKSASRFLRHGRISNTKWEAPDI